MCCTLGKMCWTLGRTIKFRSYLHLRNVHFSKAFARHRNTFVSFRKACWVFQRIILIYGGSLRLIFHYSERLPLKTKEWSQNRNRDPPIPLCLSKCRGSTEENTSVREFSSPTHPFSPRYGRRLRIFGSGNGFYFYFCIFPTKFEKLDFLMNRALLHHKPLAYPKPCFFPTFWKIGFS